MVVHMVDIQGMEHLVAFDHMALEMLPVDSLDNVMHLVVVENLLAHHLSIK